LHKFGAHLSIAGGMHHALEDAHRLGCDTVAIFTKNQRQWRAPPFKPDDLARWHTLRAAPGFGPPVAHATYLINLASASPELYERSRETFVQELLRCDELRIPYLVIHPGAAGDQPIDAAIQRVADALNAIFNNYPQMRAMPLLEATAGQGTALGRTFRELGAILRRINGDNRVGVCVDTCHVFAAGYDIRTPQGYAAMVAEADEHIGLQRIRAWHLNDSRGDLGSRIDRHEHIGRGRIGPAGFQNLLADHRFLGLPMILETPKGLNAAGKEWDAINLQRLRTLARAATARGRALRHAR
jgi:deoxyribonuclease-4